MESSSSWEKPSIRLPHRRISRISPASALSSSEYVLQYFKPNRLFNPTEVSHFVAASEKTEITVVLPENRAQCAGHGKYIILRCYAMYMYIEYRA